MTYLQIKNLLRASGYIHSSPDIRPKLVRLQEMGFLSEIDGRYTPTQKFHKFCLGTTVLLYNPNRKAFMMMPYSIEAINGKWYGLRGNLGGLLWRKVEDLKLA